MIVTTLQVEAGDTHTIWTLASLQELLDTARETGISDSAPIIVRTTHNVTFTPNSGLSLPLSIQSPLERLP